MKNSYQKLEDNFGISRAVQLKMINDLHTEMSSGLIGQKSSLRMMPSFAEPPKGNETGKYLSLDFGGTNLRIAATDLMGNGNVVEICAEKKVIDKNVQAGSKENLFDFIAESLSDFIVKNDMNNSDDKLLGFTFSFPFEQLGLTSGKLLSWTKGFSVGGVVGEDVVKLLNESIAKKGIKNIKIVSLVNDTVGALAYGRYKNSGCDMSVILGTGTNAAYIEDVSKIKKYALGENLVGKMMVNTEWGNFSKLPRTAYDKKLDEATENSGLNMMEKMVSAKYVAELVKIIFSDFVDRNIFSVKIDKQEQAASLFAAENISEVVGDNSPELKFVEKELKSLGMNGTNLKDRILFKKICDDVMERSSQIIATMIVGVVLWMDPKFDKSHVVAIDGTLYEKASGYKKSLMKNVDNLLGNNAGKIALILSKDGSGMGAAITGATRGGVSDAKISRKLSAI